MIDSTSSVRIRVRRSAILVVALGLLALLAALLVRSLPVSRPNPRLYNVFHVLFVRDEIPALVLMMPAVTVLALFLLSSIRAVPSIDLAGKPEGRKAWRLLCLGVLTLTSAGTFLVCHNYPLSLDEYLARFQATIFSAGHVTAPVPVAWQPWGEALCPKLLPIEKASHVWVSNYLPVWSGILALFQWAGLSWLASPLLAAGSLGLLSAIRRNAAPDWRWNPWVAALLLATSSQFLVTAMTAYAMTAHLFFNLLWLWAFTLPRCSGYWLAAWIGFLAIGLHQPMVHLVFAFPFLFRLVRERAWGWCLYFLGIYVAALVFYSLWLNLGHVPSLAAGVDAGLQTPYMLRIAALIFRPPGVVGLLIQVESLGMTLGWASPLALLLLALSLGTIRSRPPLARDLLYSLLLTVGIYIFFKSDQGHGWGYRYIHGVLGNIAILAAMGFEELRSHVSATSLRRLLWLNAAIVVLILLPLRFYQVETFIAPFARASSVLAAMPDRQILLQTEDIWYGSDLVRNDPLFRQPSLIFSDARLTDVKRRELLQTHSVRMVTGADLAGTGLVTEAMGRAESTKAVANPPASLRKGQPSPADLSLHP